MDANTTDTAETFSELSDELLLRIKDCEHLKAKELVRLRPILEQLRGENATLTANLNTSSPIITATTLQILKEVPVKCFVTPAPGLFDEVMPRLADYQITFEDDFGHDERFDKVMRGFGLFCKSEEVLLKSFEVVKNLAKENQTLRTKFMMLSSGDQLAELEKANGTLPCLDLFIRRVPFKVSSMVAVPENDPLRAYEEFTRHNKHVKLVLEALIPVTEGSNTYYHPFSERYVPPLWADGVPSTAVSWKRAEECRVYKWEGMVEVQEPGDAGGIRWFPPLPEGGSWEY